MKQFHIEIVFDKDFKGDDWEWVGVELNELLGLNPLATWEFGSGCSAENDFRDKIVLEKANKLIGKKIFKKYKVTEVKS